MADIAIEIWAEVNYIAHFTNTYHFINKSCLEVATAEIKVSLKKVEGNMATIMAEVGITIAAIEVIKSIAVELDY